MKRIISVCPVCNHVSEMGDKGQDLIEVTCKNHHIYHHHVEHLHTEAIQDEQRQMIMDMLVERPKYQHFGDKTTVCFIKLKNGLEFVGTSTINDESKFVETIGRDIARKHAIRAAIQALGGRENGH